MFGSKKKKEELDIYHKEVRGLFGTKTVPTTKAEQKRILKKERIKRDLELIDDLEGYTDFFD